ncbi:MAG TPA: xylose isomerase [Verrucomicrobiales bacterium]|nr:xylose isomerase [Verrucomicrobiales bacterium]
MNALRSFAWLLALVAIVAASPARTAEISLPRAGLFARTNLVAWCIVPFDAKKRGPAARAKMLDELGIRRLAYDYRAEHVPTFDEEIATMKRHGIELTAWWFPTVLNDEARLILATLKRHKVSPQLWIMGGGTPVSTPSEQERRVTEESKRIRELAVAAAEIGSRIGLYNHGGWFGQPENQIAIIERLKADGITNVGIVYNLHHGHEHLDRFAKLLGLMKPHLIALNLNGMDPRGDELGRKILPVGEGKLDRDWIKIVSDSGWFGPIGILNHTDEDAEVRLRRNLEGLSLLCTDRR